jgi:hypothetical protein
MQPFSSSARHTAVFRYRRRRLILALTACLSGIAGLGVGSLVRLHLFTPSSQGAFLDPHQDFPPLADWPPAAPLANDDFGFTDSRSVELAPLHQTPYAVSTEASSLPVENSQAEGISDSNITAITEHESISHLDATSPESFAGGEPETMETISPDPVEQVPTAVIEERNSRDLTPSLGEATPPSRESGIPTPRELSSPPAPRSEAPKAVPPLPSMDLERSMPVPASSP